MFKILPHTADVRLYVSAQSPEEMFKSSLEGMAYLQGKDFCKGGGDSFAVQDKLELSAPDMTSLLIDFLSEVLTLSHINGVIYCEMDIAKLTNTDVKATIKGRIVEYFEEDIKAVTYHEAEVRNNDKSQWETIIIFDI